MKNTNRLLLLLSFLFLLTATSFSQQLPSEKLQAALLNSSLKEKAEKMKQQMAGAPASAPGQERLLPSMTDPKKKNYPKLQVTPRAISERDKVKMLPSNTTKTRPPVRRPPPQHQP